MAKAAVIGFALQQRDHDIVRALLECRMMTLRHAADLFFDGKIEGAKKRLQKLKQFNYIREDRSSRFAPALLFLGKRGLKLLNETGVVASLKEVRDISLAKRMDVSASTRQHELAVMDVKCAFAKAVRADGRLSLTEFSTWTVLNHFTTTINNGGQIRTVSVFPDGFIRIKEVEPDGSASESTFFLEMDMGTEPQKELANRAQSYLNHYRTGGLALKNGRPPSDYKEFPFRVLFVFKSEERLRNAAKRFLQGNQPIYTHAWMTTFDEVVNLPLGAIWRCPADLASSTVKRSLWEDRNGAEQRRENP